ATVTVLRPSRASQKEVEPHRCSPMSEGRRLFWLADRTNTHLAAALCAKGFRSTGIGAATRSCRRWALLGIRSLDAKSTSTPCFDTALRPSATASSGLGGSGVEQPAHSGVTTQIAAAVRVDGDVVKTNDTMRCAPCARPCKARATGNWANTRVVWAICVVP